MRKLLLALGVSAGLVLTCAPGVPQEERPAKQDKPDLKSRSQKHQKDVTTLRGLEFKREVTVGIYSKKELLEFLKAEFERELPREKAERYQRGYAKFGLIPENLNLYEAYMELFSSSIAGFYHPRTKELRLIRAGEENNPEAEALKAMGIDMDAITLVHELTHAAQDQSFELSTLPLEDETNDDLILALKGVIEGDASAVGWKFALGERFDRMIGLINSGYKGGQLPGKAAELPAYLRLWLTFPYGHGTDFVVKAFKGGAPLNKMDRLYKEFPLSSEQILHPAKYYDAPDFPTLVTLPDLEKLFGGGWKEAFQNVHGEFSVNILLKEFRSEKLGPSMIRKASEGWDGDRYVILERDGKETMYVWYTTWDSEEDAREFYEAYELALARKHAFELEEKERTTLVFKTKSGTVSLERRGADVLVLDGATDEMLKKAPTIWKEAKKTEMTSFERLRKFVCAKCGVKEAFSGKCAKCGAELKFEESEESREPKKRKEYRLQP